MKKLPLSILIFTLTWHHSLSEDDKTIEKRQSCSGGNCGGTVESSMSRSFVEYIPPIPCPGGNCGGNGGNSGGGFINYVPPRPCPGGNCGGNGGNSGGGFINYVPPRPCPGGNCGGYGGSSSGGFIDYTPYRPCPGGNCGGNGGYIIPDYRPCPGGNCGGGYRPCSGRNCGYSIDEGETPFDVRSIDRSWISGSCRGGNCGSCSGGNCGERQNNCCYVMHPRQCYTDENGDKRCQIRRHRECSDLCTSSVVSIQEGRGNNRGRGCHYIQNYPYAYCGDYERYDCGQCYTCGGRYQPSECQRRKECPDGCRI